MTDLIPDMDMEVHPIFLMAVPTATGLTATIAGIVSATIATVQVITSTAVTRAASITAAPEATATVFTAETVDTAAIIRDMGEVATVLAAITVPVMDTEDTVSIRQRLEIPSSFSSHRGRQIAFADFVQETFQGRMLPTETG